MDGVPAHCALPAVMRVEIVITGEKKTFGFGCDFCAEHSAGITPENVLDRKDVRAVVELARAHGVVFDIENTKVKIIRFANAVLN